MSQNKWATEKIKEKLGRDRYGGDDRRRVFGGAVKRLPWWSPFRPTIFISMAVIASLGIMSKPLYDLIFAITRSIQYEFKDKKKFIKELDEEFEREEQQQQQTNSHNN